MKFLVTTKAHAVQQGMTSAIVQATQEMADRDIKNGVIDVLYAFADGSGSVGIANADSGEALAQSLLGLPAAPFFDFEARPLAEFNKVVNLRLDALKKNGL